jgi:hypothetical protein
MQEFTARDKLAQPHNAVGDEATTYTVRKYSTGERLGEITLTAAQFGRYESIAQQPEGLMRLGALPHDLYDLDADRQDTHEDTTIYLD